MAQVLEMITNLVFPETEPTEKQLKLLETIREMTEKELNNRLGTTVVPEQLEYITVGVSVIRFNRIGSEGMVSESVEGHSMQWPSSDFDPYLAAIEEYKGLDGNTRLRRGRVKWL